jgi:diguanylate cyclase (GGDEF)-like protein
MSFTLDQALVTGALHGAQLSRDSALREFADQEPAQAPISPAGSEALLVCEHGAPGLAAELAYLAAPGRPVEPSTSLALSLERIGRERPALIVLAPLVGCGAAELDALERARAGDPPAPLLLVLEPHVPIAPELSARLLARRNWDLVQRGASPAEFQLRVAHLLRRTEELAEGTLWRERALHDDRTGLLRPQAFQERLHQHFAAAERHEHALTLAVIDLDRFGEVNKRHDHTVGDTLISRVGAALRSRLRNEDSAGRLGGDEFAVLLPYTSARQGEAVLLRLLEAIRAIEGGGTGSPRVTASIGCDTFEGGSLGASAMRAPSELRERAERALRAAKRGGGNVCVAYPALSGSAHQD